MWKKKKKGIISFLVISVLPNFAMRVLKEKRKLLAD